MEKQTERKGHIRELPVFKGYTVDVRLKEFRKAGFTSTGKPGKIEFVPFDTDKGDRLLSELIKTLPVDSPLLDEIANSF